MSEETGVNLLVRWLDEGRITCSVVEAGAADKLGKTASYAAASCGDMPVVIINGRKRVPIARWLSRLRGELVAVLLAIVMLFSTWA